MRGELARVEALRVELIGDRDAQQLGLGLTVGQPPGYPESGTADNRTYRAADNSGAQRIAR